MSDVASSPDSALDRALARSVLSRFLAAGLRPPSAEDLGPMLSEEGLGALRAAADLLGGESGDLALAASGVAEVEGTSPDSRREAYGRLFGHTLRGRVCPYESEYGGRDLFQQGHEMADIAGFYLAFGLQPAPAEDYRPDHVAAELEFYDFLALREAWALLEGDSAHLDVTRSTTRKFLREHLGRFGRALGSALRAEDPRGFHGACGRLLEAFISAECGRLDIPVGPASLPLRPDADEGIPMACGTPGGMAPGEEDEGDDLLRIGGGPRIP